MDLTATKISEYSNHVISIGNEKILPIVAIFGANASGKSNVLEAFRYMVTAHMNIEVQPILQQVLSSKRALVVINSCEIRKGAKDECYRIMASKNPHSEMFFAKQEISDSGYLINYMENAGAIGFQTTTSERELFQQRRLGLVNAIRVVYDKVVPE